MNIPVLAQRRVMILLEIFYGSVRMFLLFDGLFNIFPCQIVPLTLPSTDHEDSTSFSIDPAQCAYLHISRAVSNCEEKEATFNVDIDQYISTLKDVKLSSSNPSLHSPVSSLILHAKKRGNQFHTIYLSQFSLQVLPLSPNWIVWCNNST